MTIACNADDTQVLVDDLSTSSFVNVTSDDLNAITIIYDDEEDSLVYVEAQSTANSSYSFEWSPGCGSSVAIGNFSYVNVLLPDPDGVRVTNGVGTTALNPITIAFGDDAAFLSGVSLQLSVVSC